MSFAGEITRKLSALNLGASAPEAAARFRAEVEFALRLAQAHPAKQVEWEGMIRRGVGGVGKAARSHADLEAAVSKAESLLSPLGAAAKEYTVHCVGHAHLDMNWMWDWPETVAAANDTITTVDRLMEEFPTFRFSQSQASIYQVLKHYLPELYARVKRHVAEGRWEITANHWVEGDKNLASGESLCRHLLYTKRFLQAEFGLPYHAITIDWEPDTFGHAATIPTILARAGVRRYYFCRSGPGPQLFWWEGKDGSRVLAFDDRSLWYLGPLGPNITQHLFEFEQATGLKDILYVYGVGDHGGGPTRRDLRAALAMDSWPIFPRVKLSTTDQFFSIAERDGKNLPVHKGEMNFVFEGCYSSQSNIKRANRKSECALVEAECAALLGRGLAGMPYPAEELSAAWRQALFNQFHDILPGSGVHATYEHAQGLFQEVLACTGAVKTRSLRAVAGLVNTRSSCPHQQDQCTGEIGGGQGDIGVPGAISRWSAGGSCCDSFVVFNPSPWKRSEVVKVRLWDRDYADDRILVTDDSGKTMPAQAIERGDYWQHRFIGIAFPAQQLEGLGYRSYGVAASAVPTSAPGCFGDGEGTIENEFLRVQVDPASGTITHLIDKRTGVDLVPARRRLGILEYVLEAPHGMTAWVIGQTVKTVSLTRGWSAEFPQNGPWLASVRARRKYRDSTFAMTISLAAGSPRVDFALDVEWLERGSPDIGVPTLKVAFPLAIREGVARFECPNGHVERPTSKDLLTSHTHLYTTPDGIAPGVEEVPAQKWADLTGSQRGAPGPVGATLLNDSRCGHSLTDSAIRLTLLRSSYDPDPLPELGRHTIRFALQPHVGEWTVSEAAKAGCEFNLPLNVTSARTHQGRLPARKGFAEILTPNVMLSAMKKAEDSEALVVRLYEMEGRPVMARLALDPMLAPAGAEAVETDLLEQPSGKSTARMEGSVLCVEVPAFGLVTVKVG